MTEKKTKSSTAKKKTTKKKVKKVSTSKKEDDVPVFTAQNNQKDDTFVWKVGFFLLLGVVVLIGIFYAATAIDFDGMTTGSGQEPTDTNSAGAAVDADGVVTIIEYSDFECPFCARAYDTVKQIKATYGDSVVIDYRHFPLNFHPNAQKAGEASECARDQGKFWEYHDLLFANQNALTVPSLKSYAGQIGLDQAVFDNCLDTDEKKQLVLDDFNEGRAAGVTGTPTFLIGDEKLVGAQPLSAFQPIIDAALAAGGVAAPTGAAAVPSDDPEFDFIVITDESCTACDTSTIVQAITGDFFPTANLVEVAYDSAEGQALIEEHDVKAVPAYFFESAVTQAASYSRVAQVMEPKGDLYQISAGAAGKVRLLELPVIEDAAMKGDDNAPITIIEWSDFECPFCARFYEGTYAELMEQYVDTGKAKFYFMHYPLSFHANAQKAAEASECARDQGKFWEYHDVLFENQNSLGVSALKGYAGDLGLDQAQFDTCLDAGDKAQKVKDDMALGQSFGITGTPGFLVNGIPLSGAQPISAFADVIDSLAE